VQQSDLISGVLSGKDAFWIAILFGFILLAQFLRLDERMATTKRSANAGRRFCGPDSIGNVVMSDPDGRAVRSRLPSGPPRAGRAGMNR
jgi:hypothetical protein